MFPTNHDQTSIIHIIAKLEKGGAEKLIFLLSTLLKEKGICSRVLTLIEPGSFAAEFIKAGIPVDFLDISKFNLPKRFIKICLYFIKHKPKVVHTHLFHGDLYGQIVAFIVGVKKRISTLHNMISINGKLNFWALQCAYLCSTDLIMVSKSVKDFWSKLLFGCKKKMIVIYNAPGSEVNIKCNPRELPSKSSYQLLCLGSLHPVKGHIHVINCMKLLKKDKLSFHLDVYGRDRDGYTNFLNNAIVKYDLKDTVSLNGETDEPIKSINEHDIFIMPSLSEGFGMALVEAMSIGVPVIASRIPAHVEILENGKYGLLVNIEDENELKSAILSLTENPELYRRNSQAAIERSLDFTIKKMVENYVTLYTK